MAETLILEEKGDKSSIALILTVEEAAAIRLLTGMLCGGLHNPVREATDRIWDALSLVLPRPKYEEDWQARKAMCAELFTAQGAQRDVETIMMRDGGSTLWEPCLTSDPIVRGWGDEGDEG